MIIPIFIINQGCPGRCVYCRARLTAGEDDKRITEGELREKVLFWRSSARVPPREVQLAYYGGSFTCLAREEQREMLALADGLRRANLIDSVRISTRPEGLDRETLALLKKHHVTTVEIGAQSLVDEVLQLAGRRHRAQDVIQAMGDLHAARFRTALHLMIGLPGDSEEGFAASVEAAVALRPDMVRIHPTIVLAETELARAYQRGEYLPLTLAEAVRAGKFARKRFAAAKIPVIRMGLQANVELSRPGNIIAGPYHPAFGALVMEALFLDMASFLIKERREKGGTVILRVSPRDVSNLRGQRNGNIDKLKASFGLKAVEIKTDPDQKRETIGLEEGNQIRIIGMDSLPVFM